MLETQGRVSLGPVEKDELIGGSPPTADFFFYAPSLPHPSCSAEIAVIATMPFGSLELPVKSQCNCVH
jgi:hypothetical protein